MDTTLTFGRAVGSLSLALALAACSQAQLDRAARTIAAVSGDIETVARSIDAGSKIAAGDLPIACRITADIAAAADALSGSNLISAARRPILQKAVSAANALVASDLCQNPASNAALASLQIVAAVSAIRNAASSGTDLSAMSVATGSVR